jgi:Tfp pilus assembly protein PilN
VSAKLNLASQPFRNRALPWTITGVVIFLALVALVLIIASTNDVRSRTAAVRRDTDKLREQDNQLSRQASELRDALGADEVFRLDAAQRLVDRKRFSWTRFFSDLERILPESVRVTRISVRDVATKDGRTSAELDMNVVGKDPNEVTNMISEMDRGGIFHAEPLSENLLKGKGETGTEWTLLVTYAPHHSSTSPENSGSDEAKQLTASRTVAEVTR